jgi:P-type conjugative transfer protein TrbJ
MNRSIAPRRVGLVYVQSRGWLLGKLGIAVLVMAGAVLVWGPLVAGRPQAMRVVGWLASAAIALLVLGAVVRVAEAVWGTGCTAYVLVRSVGRAVASPVSALGRAARLLVLALRRLVAALAIVLLAASSYAWGYAAVVLDPTNLVQNTISALKAVESVINEVQMIANQIQQIENQIRQIENMVQNTRNLGRGLWDREALPRLIRLGEIIDQGQAIAYAMAGVDRVFRERFPGYGAVPDWAGAYDRWTRTTLDTLRGTLAAVRIHADEFADEQRRIQTLTALSDSAEGRMQAIQAGNMLAAEQIQQLVKLRQIMMAQINAQNIYMANLTNRDAQRVATQHEWVKNGNREAPVLPASGPSGSPRVTP